MRETQIIQKAKKGDRSAQGELYSAYYKKVYYLALKMTGSREDAEDIAQDSFMAAFRALPRLERNEAFEKWLMQIAANRSRNRISQQRFTTELPEGFEEYAPDPNEGLLPENVLQDEAGREILLGILHSLPASQRECVLLFYYSGLSVKEIAESLGVSEGTVKSRLNYARQKIRAVVEETEKRDDIRLHAFVPFSVLLAKDFEAVTAGCAVPALAFGGTATAAAAFGATAAKAGVFAAVKTKIIAIAAVAVILAGGTAIVATQTDLFTRGETPAAEDTAEPAQDGEDTDAEARGEKEELTPEEKLERTLVHAGHLLAGGDTAGAVEAYEEAIRLDESDPRAYQELAKVHIAAGERDSAMDVLTRGAEKTGDGALIEMMDALDAESRALNVLRTIPYYGDIESCAMTAGQAHAYAQLIADGLSGKFEGFSGYGAPMQKGNVYWDMPYAVEGYSVYDTDRAHVILGDFAADGNPYLYVLSSLVSDGSYEVFGWDGVTAQRAYGAECWMGRESSALGADYETGKVSAYVSGSMGAASHSGETYTFEKGDAYVSYTWEETLDYQTELWHVIENGVDTVYTQEEFEALLNEANTGYVVPTWMPDYTPLNEVAASPATLREMLAALNEYASILSGGEIAPVAVPELTPMAKAMREAINSYEKGSITNAVLQDMNGDGVQELVVAYRSEWACCDVYVWKNGALSKTELDKAGTSYIALIRNGGTGEYGVLYEGFTDYGFVNCHYLSGSISLVDGPVLAQTEEERTYQKDGQAITREEYDALVIELQNMVVCDLYYWMDFENLLSETMAALQAMRK